MSTPLSPAVVTETGRHELPPYLSNGVVGMRILDVPLLSSVVLVNGFSGIHPTVQVEAAAQAPDPLSGDVSLNGVWMRTSPQQVTFVDQRYDFATGELTTRFDYTAAGVTAHVEVLTFCSRKQPTVVAQEIQVQLDTAATLGLRAIVDISQVPGRLARRTLESPGRDEDVPCDGSISWEAPGGRSQCGISLVTEALGSPDPQPRQLDWGEDSAIAKEYEFEGRPGRTYRLRQIASLVPSKLHDDPDQEARRLATKAGQQGFGRLREENRLEWRELWNGRPIIDGGDEQWQRLADAAFFYLNSSVHASAPSSTSIYGLAQWNDYHYYYGHVMWDVDWFCVPPLLLLQPDAARSMLDFRARTIDSAQSNAKLHGRRGLQFPWESGPLTGDEASPGSGEASWYEDHVSLDIAWAFTQFVHATGDGRFQKDRAAPVLFGVADWIASRVTRTGTGYAILESMGIAERERPSDNDAFTIMAAEVVLREAIAMADKLGEPAPTAWGRVLAGLRPPVSGRTRAIVSHDGYRVNEEKGATPGPLAGLFPLWYDAPPAVAKATLDLYLRLAPGYIGSPMLSPLYGVWAAWAGDRRQSLRMFEEGYAELVGERYLQTLEMSPSKFPDKPRSGPFFANLGGFLSALLYGLPGIRLGSGEPESWPSRQVVLPAGWRAIEVERVWVRGEPMRLLARHGAERAVLEPATGRRRRAA
jgi:trehalose/maltose hydrolase-like predicted phosphorylase